jgi:hypothetical protein
MGVYQGNGSPGYEPDDSVYWETTTPYQSVGHYLFDAPYGSIFFTVWNSGSTDNFGNPDYFVYYHLEGDPTSHFIDDAHQNAWYESMEAQTEVRQDANATCPQIGQTDFGFPTTGPLTPTHGLSNAPYPAWPWTLWTSTSTKLETGPLAFHLVTWKPYWAFSTVDQ